MMTDYAVCPLCHAHVEQSLWPVCKECTGLYNKLTEMYSKQGEDNGRG